MKKALKYVLWTKNGSSLILLLLSKRNAIISEIRGAEKHKELKRQVRAQLRQDRTDHLECICEEIEKTGKKNESKNLFQTVGRLTKKTCPKVSDFGPRRWHTDRKRWHIGKVARVLRDSVHQHWQWYVWLETWSSRASSNSRRGQKGTRIHKERKSGRARWHTNRVTQVGRGFCG